jgi:hypothetical protein
MNCVQLPLKSFFRGTSLKEPTVPRTLWPRYLTTPRARMAAFSSPMDFLLPTPQEHALRAHE